MSESHKEVTLESYFTKGPLILFLQKQGARELFLLGTSPWEFFGTEWHLAYNIPAALGVKDDEAAVIGRDRNLECNQTKSMRRKTGLLPARAAAPLSWPS